MRGLNHSNVIFKKKTRGIWKTLWLCRIMLSVLSYSEFSSPTNLVSHYLLRETWNEDGEFENYPFFFLGAWGLIWSMPLSSHWDSFQSWVVQSDGCLCLICGLRLWELAIKSIPHSVTTLLGSYIVKVICIQRVVHPPNKKKIRDWSRVALTRCWNSPGSLDNPITLSAC